MPRYRTYKLTDAEKALLKRLFDNEELKSIPREVIRILFNRGIRDKDSIMLTLFGKIENLYNIPMRDSQEFCSRLAFASTKGEQVVIMGDYDTDGCMATCVAVLALKHLGFKVDYYMNSRFRDGYGLKVNSVNEIINRFPSVKVIITVDNGIKSFEAVDYCNSKGIDVLITDHHKPASVIPNATAVVNPKRVDCLYPFEELCGAGVVWKVMLRLCDFLYPNDLLKRDYVSGLRWLVAIATVGDQVPLISENRIIVNNVLQEFNEERMPIMNSFISRLKSLLKVDRFTSDTIGFYISPMINAMGRIEGNPLQIVDAIVNDDLNILEKVVHKMDEINKRRREMTEEQLEEALRLMENENPNNKAILVHSDKFTEGIIGIIAGRLVDKFHKPVIVLCPNEDGTYKGSCRSIPGIDIEGVLDSLSSYLINFGGHTMAAGLTIDPNMIETFKSKLMCLCDSYKDELYENVVDIDLVIKEQDVSLSLCKLVELLGPYGNSFRKPVFFLKDFRVDLDKSLQNKNNSVYFGKDCKTLRLVGSTGLCSIGFKAADKYRKMEEPGMLSLVGCPSINEYNGNSYPQFVIEKDYLVRSK